MKSMEGGWEEVFVVCVNLCWVVIPALEVPFIHHFTIVNTAEFNVITMEVNKNLTKV